jgi:hypothetical protein
MYEVASFLLCCGSESASFQGAGSRSASQEIQIRNQSEKSVPDPHQKHFSEPIEVQSGPWTFTMEAHRLKTELWTVCRPVVADSHQFDEEQDLDLHQNEISEPDPRQSEKADLETRKRNTCFQWFGGRMPLSLHLFFFIQYSRYMHTIIHLSFINIR